MIDCCWAEQIRLIGQCFQLVLLNRIIYFLCYIINSFLHLILLKFSITCRSKRTMHGRGTRNPYSIICTFLITGQ